MKPPSPLENPDNAAFAWARYKRMLRMMALVTLLVDALVLGLLYLEYGLISMHFYIATGLGIAVTMMLTGALMGLVFLSNGTGHDESVRDLDRD